MGAFLGIPAGASPAYSRIVSRLLASCEQSPFAAQFVYNLMGPIFYELTRMALPPQEQQAMTTTMTMSGEQSTVDVAALLKFLCFIYLETAVQYDSTEDVFETISFCDQLEVAELQEYCASSLRSLAENSHRHGAPSKDRLQGKRICDLLVLFLGGRIPFYFNEEELSLLHSVFIETMLDVFFSGHHRSEFDLAQSGILWVQRKVTTTTTTKPGHVPRVGEMPRSKSSVEILWNLLAVCSTGVHIFVSGGKSVARADFLILLHCAALLCSAIWTRVNGAIRMRARRIILLLFLTNPDSLEGIIAGEQPVGEIILFETGS